MTASFSLDRRSAGLLLHPTSLPGPHGSGDAGHEARRFVDLLAAAGQSWWQMLPVGPIGPGNSPYSSPSALAGNPLLIDLDELAREGLLSRSDLVPLRGLSRNLAPPRGLRDNRVCYPAMIAFRERCLRRAFDTYRSRHGRLKHSLERFSELNHTWLDDWCLFAALSRAMRGRPWIIWPAELRMRRRTALARAQRELAEECEFECFAQFLFDRQWQALKSYANRRGIGLIGDIPIFVTHNSCDVWRRPELFQLDRHGRSTVISGVPPDYFSRTGQLWGHPHYRWARHVAEGFSWWIERFGLTMRRFDAVRIDHFLGFYRVWEVPARARTAMGGRYVPTPGRELLSAVRRALGPIQIIAEDLGNVTPQAWALRDEFGFPGMRVLQFAFDGDTRYDQPHNHVRNAVVYTGTHDNDTTVGWFRSLSRPPLNRRGRDGLTTRQRVLRYLGTDGRQIHWDLIRLAYLSPANIAIVPLQDVLGLDARSRMNLPATAEGNWEWRLRPGAFTARHVQRLREMAETYERLPRKQSRERTGAARATARARIFSRTHDRGNPFRG
jgi:4-alpha-glucanotransferase